MSERLLCRLESEPTALKARHYRGFPPGMGGGSSRELLPLPAFLVIEPTPDEGVSLYRVDIDGAVVGDTWHPTLAEAQEQAEYEYPGCLGEWQDVPAEAVDAVAYGVSILPPS